MREMIESSQNLLLEAKVMKMDNFKVRAQTKDNQLDTIFPDPAWVRAGFCSTHQDLSFDTKFGHIYDNIASDPSWT